LTKLSKTDSTVSRFARQRNRAQNWLHHRLGIDHAIAFTILARGWGSLAGIITVALIARFLSRAQQGYYYTFGSLIALQIVFELGFSFVILQMASHERAHLTFLPGGLISGNPAAYSRLATRAWHRFCKKQFAGTPQPPFCWQSFCSQPAPTSSPPTSSREKLWHGEFPGTPRRWRQH
jgi:hypothetical protein